MTRMTGNTVMRRVGVFALWLGAVPAAAGVILREAETIQGNAPGGEARQVNQIRQVIAAGDNCKVVLEESSDPLIPVGAFVLASTVDAFLVDPAAKTIAPLDPTAMLPVTVAAGEAAASATIRAVTLERQVDAAGPAILGLPTRHVVVRLRYQEVHGAAGTASADLTRWDERHEAWITPWMEGEIPPAAWLKLRLSEDGGLGADRADIRDALEQIYQQGFVLRQVIERRASVGTPPAEPVAVELVTREVTSFNRQEPAAGVFEKPAGYASTEFLAPVPDAAPTSATEQGDTAGAGEAADPAAVGKTPGE